MVEIELVAALIEREREWRRATFQHPIVGHLQRSSLFFLKHGRFGNHYNQLQVQDFNTVAYPLRSETPSLEEFFYLMSPN